MTEHEKIVEGLKPMFKEAEEKGLWFHSSYQDMWFSPAELRAEQAEGRYWWGACNWTLKNPKEELERLVARLGYAQENIEKFKARMI
jgi:hypothetical protein